MQIIYIVLSIYDVYMNSERWHNEYIMNIYIYIYIYTHIFIYLFIYIYVWGYSDKKEKKFSVSREDIVVHISLWPWRCVRRLLLRWSLFLCSLPDLISFDDMLDALVTEEDEVAQIWSSDLALKFFSFDLEWKWVVGALEGL